MNENPLYLKLLGETAQITWAELEPFFARGSLMWVEPAEDLVGIALGIAENRARDVEAWLGSGALRKMDVDTARRLSEGSDALWAVVVAPWVLVQARRLGE
ncbi:DUF2288 family protein [Pseudomonas sp. Marseille-QA0892]